MKYFMKKIKGFTIIELLVCVVILGIIISLAVMAIDKYIIQGHVSIDKQLDRQLELSAKNYLTDNKNTLAVDDYLIVWYTTLKSNDYMTNDLIDSKGNSCSKSYVVVNKELNKKDYKYTTCITCENDGYSNISSKKECTSNFTSILNCSFTRKDDKKILGVNSNNTEELNLVCRGNNSVSFNNNATSLKNVFTINNGEIVSINNDTIEKNNKKSSINATISVKTINSNPLTIVFNGDGSHSKLGFIDKNTNTWTNHSAIPITIPVDGIGPKCSLSGPYKDNSYKNQVKAVKSGSKVYYKLICNDDNGIKTKNLSKDNFIVNDLVGDMKIKVNSNNKSLTGDIEVSISKNPTFKQFKLGLLNDSVLDEFDNGNDIVYSKIDNEDTTLAIDDQAPRCSFSGPSSDINIMYSKTRMNISLSPTDYVYYSLKCDDENDIENNFSIDKIGNNGFSKIEWVKTYNVSYNDIHIGYEYVIKAYSTRSEGVGYLTYNVKNTIDKVGNTGIDKVINSNNTKMIDFSKIPKCNISTSYASDLRSATLTGHMSDEKGLSGYLWTNDQGQPSRYNSISGTSNSVSNKITNNGYYYLHMKNINDLTGYCLVYITSIKEAPPKEPTLSADDGIASGAWHKDNFKLTASGSGAYATYYYGTNVNSMLYNSPMNVTTETNGTTYYAKACLLKDHTNCSGVVSYNALLDKTRPTCSLSGTKTSGGVYNSGYWTSSDVKITLTSTDSRSGVSKITMKNPLSGNSYSSYFTTSVSSNSLGTGTVNATCTDKAGNTNTDSFSIKIDKQKPTVSLSPKGKKLSGSTTITLSCSDGSGSGVESKSMKSPSGSTYTSSFTISKDGGTVTATCKDVVGNTATTSEVYKPQCTWTNWSCGAADYQKSCSKVTTDTKKVTCTSGYKKKLVYNGSPIYSYKFADNYKSIKIVRIPANTSAAAACKRNISFVFSCNASNVGKYKYAKADRKGTEASCYGYPCEKKSNGYGNYKESAPSYHKTCSPSGTKGKTASYSTCTSGYYKIDTCTRSCK